MANLVRVKEKFQVTIPVSLRSQLSVREGDYLEATVMDDCIVLRPRQMSDSAAKKPGLLDFLMEPRSATRSRDEIDMALAADRATWGK